ncbi:MAG: hypothetical protein DMF69_10105 [Acidobacteria bacterium]|nr:MAG: hypothetical protein DMF69_10105 [Acidobacteriota bacterium]
MLSCAKAATNRSRSPAVKLFAFLRTRTIIFTEPTSVAPTRASILTSLSLVLGCPNFPATKKGTEIPVMGTDRDKVGENSPVVPLRNTTAPPLAPPETKESRTVTIGEVAPLGFVTRIRHGEGAQETNWARGFALLLICNSTFIINLLLRELLEHSFAVRWIYQAQRSQGVWFRWMRLKQEQLQEFNGESEPEDSLAN